MFIADEVKDANFTKHIKSVFYKFNLFKDSKDRRIVVINRIK